MHHRNNSHLFQPHPKFEVSWISDSSLASDSSYPLHHHSPFIRIYVHLAFSFSLLYKCPHFLLSLVGTSIGISVNIHSCIYGSPYSSVMVRLWRLDLSNSVAAFQPLEQVVARDGESKRHLPISDLFDLLPHNVNGVVKIGYLDFLSPDRYISCWDHILSSPQSIDPLNIRSTDNGIRTNEMKHILHVTSRESCTFDECSSPTIYPSWIACKIADNDSHNPDLVSQNSLRIYQ
jgi:hypothetical protein